MRNKIKLFVFLMLILLSLLFVQFVTAYSAACETFAEQGIKGTVTNDINKLIANILINDKERKNYETINTNEDGRITSIIIETAQINAIALDIANNIYEKISEFDYNFGLPLGNAFGIRMLSGYGPKIKFRITPLGITNFDIKSEVISSGINQSLHRIRVVFTTEIVCLAPFNESIECIETELILTEYLIIGEIPQIFVQR